jgi:hypothetical protein
MATTTFRSELYYRTPIAEHNLNRVNVKGEIQKLIDSVVEYPGSRKGDFGEWRLTDWLASKIEGTAGRGGSERR